jgi:hypothetical protein
MRIAVPEFLGIPLAFLFPLKPVCAHLAAEKILLSGHDPSMSGPLGNVSLAERVLDHLVNRARLYRRFTLLTCPKMPAHQPIGKIRQKYENQKPYHTPLNGTTA